jgi:hypothetical protein
MTEIERLKADRNAALDAFDAAYVAYLATSDAANKAYLTAVAAQEKEQDA